MVIRAGEGHVSKESATPISQTGRRSPSSKIFIAALLTPKRCTQQTILLGVQTKF